MYEILEFGYAERVFQGSTFSDKLTSSLLTVEIEGYVSTQLLKRPNPI